MPKVCPGPSERTPCIFATKKIGEAARGIKGNKCLFCSPEKMKAACATEGGRNTITRYLKAFRAEYVSKSHVYNSAMMLVPDEWRDKFHEQALKRTRGKPARPRNATVDAQANTLAAAWKDALASRKRAFKDLNNQEVTAYKKRRKADRNRVEKKFFADNQLPTPEAVDIAENDAGLPPAMSSERAAFVEKWCKFGSFGICKECHSLQLRPLHQLDTRRVALAEITGKACKSCKDGAVWVPQPKDIPKPLKKLSQKMACTLRPLDLYVGPVKKASNGYRLKSSMTRMSWSETAVKDKIAEVGFNFVFVRVAPRNSTWRRFRGTDGSMSDPAWCQVSSRSKREKLREAYDYLMSKEADSSYRDLVKKHNKFLRKHSDPTDSDRRLPLQFIETPGPHFCCNGYSIFEETRFINHDGDMVIGHL